MKFEFYKYQGTGNDFIMIDGDSQSVNFSVDQIKHLCDRRFGIGGDGLIILNKHKDFDFEIDYYNADGTKSFCGNGSRCAQAFAKELDWINDNSKFLAIDGPHLGKCIGEDFATKMKDVSVIDRVGEDYFINTGSPHYIKYINQLSGYNVIENGREIRNSPAYAMEGTNVNFVEAIDDILHVRTYERGVEEETYSCGTGVTAAAISYIDKTKSEKKKVAIQTKGGSLTIALEREENTHYKNIWLIGPAVKVFSGSFSI